MMDTMSTRLAPTALQEEPDEALMLRFGRGELGAFDELYRRNEMRVWRFIRRSVPSAALADELMQDVWMRVIAQASRYEPQAQFITWLSTIARNRVIDAGRVARPVERLDDALPPVDGSPGPEELAMHSQQGQLLLAALERLPWDQREAFLLQVEAGLSVADIGLATGVPTETAKSRLRYARAALRAALGDAP
jgi:RNA polymerase sigma factor (sigma-70 family)